MENNMEDIDFARLCMELGNDSPLNKALNAGLNTEEKYEVPMQDFIELQKNKITKFDTDAWNKGKGYEAPNFPLWSEYMEGLDNGFYIFAGYSNSGKSAMAMNLAYDYAMNPDNHLSFLYFTLDDTAQMIIPRMISMTHKVPISIAAKPQRYKDMIDEVCDDIEYYQNMLNKRQEGLNQLLENSNKIMIQDSSDMDCAEKMLEFALKYKTFLQTHDPKANIIVVVDSLMDINIDSQRTTDERDRNTKISRLMKEWADTKLQCPVFGTAHLKKNTGTKRPVISDLKESGRYEYDATAVFLVINEVSRCGQNADIYYTKSDGDPLKHPIIEIQWAKNKASSFKERTYYYFEPIYSKVVECNKQMSDQFDQIIYSS